MKENLTDIWKKYEEGLINHSYMELDSRRERAYKFYEGDQWFESDVKDKNLPCYNFVKPTVNYRFNSVMQNKVSIIYGSDEIGKEKEICAELNRLARKHWEQAKLDKLCSYAVKDACISGDSYLYFYNDKAQAQNIANIDIFFGDETVCDIQSQPWIIIRERLFVEEVKKQAKKNGISQKLIDEIRSDEDNENSHFAKSLFFKSEEHKCTSLLFMTKIDGTVHISRSVKNVIYQPDTAIIYEKKGRKPVGLSLYPIASMIWTRQNGTAHGIGECLPIIPNQVKCNENLVHRLSTVKLAAYGKPVYNVNAIANPEALFEAGASIQVDGVVGNVRDYISYLEPASMASDAHILANELINKTRDLAGASDTAIGQIDPTKASGVAIMAVREQSALPINEYIKTYQQFVEDIAKIFLDIWSVYNPDGLVSSNLLILPKDILRLRDSVRVDISPTDSFSKYAEEQSLENALKSGYITFEEYVEALPQNAVAPRESFMKIIEKRRITENNSNYEREGEENSDMREV